MSDPNLSIDPALLAEFIDESLDMLSSIDELFVELERAPKDLDIVQSIFRPIHSIKGNSAFFGLTHVKRLSHESENLLDLIRKEKLFATKETISILLKSSDELRQMLERSREGSAEITDEPAFEVLVKEVIAAAQVEEAAPEMLWEKAFALLGQLRKAIGDDHPTLRAPVEEALAVLGQLAPKQEPATQDAPAAAATEGPLPAAAQTIMAALEGSATAAPTEEQLTELSNAISELPQIAQGEKAQTIAAELLDTFQTFTSTVGWDDLVRDTIAESMQALAECGAWATAQPVEVPAPEPAPEPEQKQDNESPKEAPTPAAETPKAGAMDSAKTMRVSEAHVDAFLSYVSELLVVGDMFGHLQSQLEAQQVEPSLRTDFRRVTQTFLTLSTELQRSIMAIRKIPVGGLFKRVPRIVRDVANESGKEILVTLEGEGICVDKSHIDLLDAPLTHIARNAADHGIEPPDVRERNGKPREGKIHVALIETESHFVLSVKDDGAGIDKDALRNKAENMGLIKPGQPLDQEAMVQLLFTSGVSTAKKVTDVSGRGVGMDVVRRAVEEADGRITVDTRQGEGSEFRVSLPKSVTTQIIAGFLVMADHQCYVLPMGRVKETIHVEKDEISTVTGRGRCIVRHGDVIPVVDLRRVLGLPTNGNNRPQELMVTLESGSRTCAVVIDDVRGVQQVVFRPLDALESRSDLLTGAALMGDGSVALILDADKLHSA